jgi:hypothetical protein
MALGQRAGRRNKNRGVKGFKKNWVPFAGTKPFAERFKKNRVPAFAGTQSAPNSLRSFKSG